MIINKYRHLYPACTTWLKWKKVCHQHMSLRKLSIYSDTIFALSSGFGKCGVAVIRLSGQQAGDALKMICQKDKLPKPRMAKLLNLYDPQTKEEIDKGLVLWFPATHSFTAEDSVEFQVHGGVAVIAAMANALGKVEGLRPAEAGEFTKRAFLNNKMDLTEVEGLGDLIHAETEAQRKQALRQMGGDLSDIYTKWRQQLIKSMASIEAYIDFGEEETIEEDILETVNNNIDFLENEITNHLDDNRQGERLRDGVHVVILGEPNVGKSSLLNTLSRRPTAIVSSIPGTTRDVIETSLNIGGYPVLLSDTAGLRDTSDVIESEGVRRAINRANSADLKILLIDSTSSPTILTDPSNIVSTINDQFKHLGISKCFLPQPDEHIQDKRINYSSGAAGNETIIVFNKIDLLSKDMKLILKNLLKTQKNLTLCGISCETDDGIDIFVSILKEKIEKLCGNMLVNQQTSPSLTQARHRHHLQHCLACIHDYRHWMKGEVDVVMAAQSLRDAATEIGRITGRITTEDILDVVFKDFCIGK